MIFFNKTFCLFLAVLVFELLCHQNRFFGPMHLGKFCFCEKFIWWHRSPRPVKSFVLHFNDRIIVKYLFIDWPLKASTFCTVQCVKYVVRKLILGGLIWCLEHSISIISHRLRFAMTRFYNFVSYTWTLVLMKSMIVITDTWYSMFGAISQHYIYGLITTLNMFWNVWTSAFRYCHPNLHYVLKSESKLSQQLTGVRLTVGCSHNLP